MNPKMTLLRWTKLTTMSWLWNSSHFSLEVNLTYRSSTSGTFTLNFWCKAWPMSHTGKSRKSFPILDVTWKNGWNTMLYLKVSFQTCHVLVHQLNVLVAIFFLKNHHVTELKFHYFSLSSSTYLWKYIFLHFLSRFLNVLICSHLISCYLWFPGH